MNQHTDFTEKIGLDKMTIHGFRILNIDESKLLRNTNVSYEKNVDLSYQLSDGNSFKRLKIVDNKLFGALKAGTKVLAKCKQDYATMDIFVSNEYIGNIQNYSHEEYKVLLHNIYMYLQDRYGIEIDLYGIRIKKMEINCTLKLEQPYSAYRRVFQLIMSNLPKNYKTNMTCTNTSNRKNNSETFYRFNDSIMWKIYDKTTQLKQSKDIYIPYNTVRFEITLKTPKKIKEVFGTNLFFDFDNEMIVQYFMKLFWEQIEIKYSKWQEQNQKFILDKIIELKKNNPNKWQDVLLTFCRNEEILRQYPVLLDINDILLQIRHIANGHYSRIKTGLLSKCEHDDVFLQNDSEKIQEILHKINSIYECMTSSENNPSITPPTGKTA